MNTMLKAAGSMLVATTLMMSMPAIAEEAPNCTGGNPDPFGYCGDDRDIAIKCWYIAGETERYDYVNEAIATIMITGQGTKYVRAAPVTNLVGDVMNAAAPSGYMLFDEDNDMAGLQHMATECQNYLWLAGCNFWMKMPWGYTEADLDGMTDMDLMMLGMEGDVSPFIYAPDTQLI